MRHAKSGYPAGVGDHDRPLAERGERDGAAAGEWLRHQVGPIDEVLCSTSARTRATVAVLGLSAPIRTAAEIYEASADDILEQIRQTAATVRVLLVVGHAPGMPALATELAGVGSLEGPLTQVRARFPTAGMAVLEIGTEWPGLDSGEGRLIGFHVPRG